MYFEYWVGLLFNIYKKKVLMKETFGIVRFLRWSLKDPVPAKFSSPSGVKEGKSSVTDACKMQSALFCYSKNKFLTGCSCFVEMAGQGPPVKDISIQ